MTNEIVRLGLIADMKRYLEMKMRRPPSADDELGWMQVAQHYGLPTRLLDWTQNAAVALFFACCHNPDNDGLVVILNPIELNQMVDPRMPRILTFHKDEKLILPYFKLGSRANPRGGERLRLTRLGTRSEWPCSMEYSHCTAHGVSS